MSQNESEQVPNSSWQLPGDEGNQYTLEAAGNTNSVETDNAHLWWGKGIILGKSGQCEDALKAFDNAISLDPDHAVAWDSKGIVLNKLGMPEEVVQRQYGISDVNPED